MKFTEETLEQAVIELFDAVQIPHCKGETIIYKKWLVPKWNTPQLVQKMHRFKKWYVQKIHIPLKRK